MCIYVLQVHLSLKIQRGRPGFNCGDDSADCEVVPAVVTRDYTAEVTFIEARDVFIMELSVECFYCGARYYVVSHYSSG